MKDRESDPAEKIGAIWYCGLYVGSPLWQGIENYEPDECATEFEMMEDTEEWNGGQCSATCPSCGGTLTQEYDLPKRQEERPTPSAPLPPA